MDTFPDRPDRHPVELNGSAVLADGSTIHAVLLDLSYEGCKIRPGSALSPGDRIKLAVFRRGLIDAEVRWFEDGIAGLVFSETQAPANKQWPRRSDRVAVTANVTVRRPGQANFEARILDASPEGCKVEFIDRPKVGDRMWVKFEGLENLDAEVCWVEGFVMGLNFDKAMHPAVFDLLVERMTQDD